jgi:hypothetical protein
MRGFSPSASVPRPGGRCAFRPALHGRDVGDAGGEHAADAGQLFIDQIRHAMTAAAKIRGIAGLPVGEQLLATQHIKDLKLDLELVAGRLHHPTDHQRLQRPGSSSHRSRLPCPWWAAAACPCGPWGQSGRSGQDRRPRWPRRPGAAGHRCIGPAKGHHGNRYRLVHAGGDLDLQLGAEAGRNQQQGKQCGCAVQAGSAHEAPDPDVPGGYSSGLNTKRKLRSNRA